MSDSLKNARIALVEKRVAAAWNFIDKEKCRAAYIQRYMETGNVYSGGALPFECTASFRRGEDDEFRLTHTEARNSYRLHYGVSEDGVYIHPGAFIEFSSSSSSQ